MSCTENCNPCKARENYVCHGDFFTTGEYASIIKEFDMHGVTFPQKIDSVKPKLDIDTIRIIKALICESNTWSYSATMEIMYVLDEILSRLSTDNKIDSTPQGDDQ